MNAYSYWIFTACFCPHSCASAVPHPCAAHPSRVCTFPRIAMSCCNPTHTPDYPIAAGRAHGWSIATLVVGIVLLDPFKIIAGSMPVCCLRPGPGGNAKCLITASCILLFVDTILSLVWMGVFINEYVEYKDQFHGYYEEGNKIAKTWLVIFIIGGAIHAVYDLIAGTVMFLAARALQEFEK